MTGKDRRTTGKLPEYLTHPLTIAAAAIVGVSLITGPLFALGVKQSAEKPAPAREAAATKAPAADVKPAVAEKQPTAKPAAAPAEAPAPAPAPKTDLIAFYANFDEKGLSSLERNAEHIGTLMPMWYHLGSNGKLTFDDSHAARVMKIIRKKNPDMKVMPILNNYDKATESWNAPQVGKMLQNASKRRTIAKRIVKTYSAAGYDGINIDFESFTEKDRKNLVKFMAVLYPLARDAGLEVSMDVIVLSRTYDHAALAKHVDYLIPMMYDEHWKTSGPGAIASIPWFRKTLDRFLEQVPAEKVVVGMGVYAYDWGKSGQRAKSLTYADAVRIAAKHDRPIKLKNPRLNSSFSYKNGGANHQVWMLDAMSAYNQVSTAQKKHVRGYAIWRIGAEDPALWDVLPYRDSLDAKVAESLEGEVRTVQHNSERNLITYARAAK